MGGWEGVFVAEISFRKQIPVVAEVEVLVAGGGPAGIAAALAAARQGASTMLLEKNGYIGGNLTVGLVGPCMTSYSLDGEEMLIRGIFEELVLAMEREGGARHPATVPAGSAYCGFIVFGHDKVTPFEPEAVKRVALRLLMEAGVSLQFHTMVVDALVDEGAVTGVVMASKSGLEAVRAQVVVDCTADADVVALGGGRFELGRPEDGLMQPMTLFFRVAGVDDQVVESYVAAHPEDYRPFASIVQAAREAGEFPIPRKGIGLYRTLEPGVWRINTTRLHHLDGTNVRDLTQGEIGGREQVDALMRFFRARLPGFERSELLDTAATVGVRETRRIVGEYVLTEDDLATGRHFDDVIALCGYPVDVHSPTGDGGGTDGTWQTANQYEIPYRCLVPERLDGVLVAGRSISATHVAMGATRVMPPCFAMGEAAGVAAAMSVASGRPPRAIDVGEMQRRLVEGGAWLGAR
jgi:glycine/D-amino acid oxidase-like deaminating enzyme